MSTTAGPQRREILHVRPAPPGHWVGDGFPVRTIFSYQDEDLPLSPFLLLDYAEPVEFPPAEQPRGVGEHPHRGFETVTIVYQGGLEHRDSAGHHGVIGPGDVQWMTAASGVVHEEFHAREFTQSGGIFEVAQLWVNLPAAHKMSSPAYQTLVQQDIPVVALPADAGTVRVIAGEFQGQRGPARTFTPLELWDVRLMSGAHMELEVADGFSLAVFLLHGRLRVNDAQTLGNAELAVFARTGETIALEALSESSLLVLGGEPIDEPVVGRGPFVMNSADEIRQAITDYQRGAMGHLR